MRWTASITWTANRKLLNGMLRTAESRYAAGRGSQQDILRAQTQLAIYATQRVRYEQTRAARQIEINALLNRPQGGRIEVRACDGCAHFGDSPRDAAAGAGELAAGGARKDVVQGSELAASLARKDYAPDYTLSGGYFNQGGLPPLWRRRWISNCRRYFWRKQRAEVTGREASASQARHEYAATLVEVEAEIREQYSTAEASLKLVNLYEKTVIPEARLAYESALASYQAGRGDFIAPFTSFISVVDYNTNGPRGDRAIPHWRWPSSKN